jgi:hypothetical protein
MSRVSLDSGILYYQARKKERKRQWIEDTVKQQQIVSSVHKDTLDGCHFGRDKTREKVLHRYFWHEIGEDLEAYVKTMQHMSKSTPFCLGT